MTEIFCIFAPEPRQYDDEKTRINMHDADAAGDVCPADCRERYGGEW